MADFIVRIPRVSVAISEATLVDVLVPEGGHVTEGEPLILIETEKVETEVPAGATGTVHWTGETGTSYDVGAEVGVIHTAE
jgi:pyruvate/2-oxoglutarate dehydrogenase complex dihydrolipoamide acyltransferase (E2) component